MIKIDLKRHRKEIIGSVVVLLVLLGGMSVFKYTSFNSGFEIVDDLGGNIFPSAILSVATTDAQVIGRNAFFLPLGVGICIKQAQDGIYDLS